MRTKLTLIAALFILTGSVAAQDEPAADSARHPQQPDTVLYQPEEALEGYIEVDSDYDSERNLSQNPTAALFKSMLVPGLGQIGNRAWFKAAFFASLEGVLIVSALNYRSKASDLYDQYQAAEGTELRNQLHDRYEDRANKRNRYTWFAVITVFISMFDAYVDAHLSGFPIKDEDRIGFQIGPSRHCDVVCGLTLRF